MEEDDGCISYYWMVGDVEDERAREKGRAGGRESERAGERVRMREWRSIELRAQNRNY